MEKEEFDFKEEMKRRERDKKRRLLLEKKIKEREKKGIIKNEKARWDEFVATWC